SNGSPFWVSDNGADVSTLYSGGVNGTKVVQVPLTVSIPGGAPTGVVFNGTSDFVVGSGSASGPAFFIFASESGNITGRNPNVPAAGSTTAQVEFSSTTAVYKGLAIGNNGSGNFLYAANFHDGTIDVFDRTFTPTHLAGSFTDPGIPSGFAPFNILNLG